MTCPDDCNGSYWECLACKGPPEAPAPRPTNSLATCAAVTLVGGCWVYPLIEPMVKL